MRNRKQVTELLNRYFEAPHALVSDVPCGGPRKHHLRPLTNQARWELAGQISDLLGADAGFLGPFEVAALLEEFTFLARPDAAPAGLSEEVLALLDAPPRRWRFRAPLLKSQGLKHLVLDLGGPMGLVTQLALNEQGIQNLWLCGDLLARTREGAAIQVERWCLSWLGAAYVLGAVDLYFDPLPQSYAGSWYYLDEQGFDLRPAYCAVVDLSVASTPSDLTDLERVAAARNDDRATFERRIRLLRTAMTSQSPHAQRVRNACQLAARAATAMEFGECISLSFGILEGLLLGSSREEGISGRLKEAVAHGLGKGPEDRDALRTLADRLYQQRSEYVHTGQVYETSTSRQLAVDLVTRVLLRELEALSVPQ